MSEVIDVRNLTKELKGKNILRDVSFSVNEGEIFGYLGPNGSGKTTTMRILLGLIEPTSGEARIFNSNLGKHNEIRRQVGVVLESRGLYEHLTAYKNLEFFCRVYKIKKTEIPARIREVMEYVDLWDRRNDKVGIFSNGMKQKLALMRALLPNPQLLLLDEPTSGLDPEAQKTVRDLILELKNNGHTIFLNSHDLSEVQMICTRVAILHNGVIIAHDSVKNLTDKLTKPIYEIYVEDMKGDIAEKINTLDYVVESSVNKNKIILELRDQKEFSNILDMLIREGVKVKEAKHISKNLEDVYLTLVKGTK